VTYRGTVQSGVVVLPAGVTLPEGAEVVVTMPDASAPTPSEPPRLGDKLAELGRWAESLPTDLPPDLAANHDHYLHGLPKRQ
jgi:hypothetical protein